MDVDTLAHLWPNVLLCQGKLRDFPSSSGAHGYLGLAHERLNSTAAGLPSTEWWRQYRAIGLFSALSVRSVVLLTGHNKWERAFSTIKVYFGAISACHVGFGRDSVGHLYEGHTLEIVCFQTSSWDLSLVLDALCQQPFEPLVKIDMKSLSLKAGFTLHDF